MIQSEDPLTPQELVNILRSHFSVGELRDLCFMLKIDYEIISGENKFDKARELVEYVRRHGTYSLLCKLLRDLRPHEFSNISSLGDMLLSSLDPDDTRISDVKRLQEHLISYHRQLSEWKELHNHLNGILIKSGFFTHEVKRNASRYSLDPLNPGLENSWYPIRIRVELLLNWAKDIKYIGEPFRKLQNGETVGSDWAVIINIHSQAINTLLQECSAIVDSIHSVNKWRRRLHLIPKSPKEAENWWASLKNAADAFDSEIQTQMYLADGELRRVASVLLDLSKFI